MLARIAEAEAKAQANRAAIRGFLIDFGQTPARGERLIPQFGSFLERYGDLMREAVRRTNLPADLEAERARARAAIEDGRLDEADAILRGIGARLHADREAREKRIAEEREAADQERRDEAAILTERAQIAATRLRYREAADLYGEAASVLPEEDWEVRGNVVFLRGVRLCDLGNEFGDNDALHEAVAAYDAALNELTRDRSRDGWARTQNNRGNALLTLGERSGNEDMLNEAVRSYDNALLEHTRERVPLEWARTHNNRGGALQTLGQRSENEDMLNEAVRNYDQALLERTRERVPLQWALTTANRAGAFEVLAAMRGDAVAAREAVEARREVLALFEAYGATAYVEKERRNLARAEALLALLSEG